MVHTPMVAQFKLDADSVPVVTQSERNADVPPLVLAQFELDADGVARCSLAIVRALFHVTQPMVT
mgnify:CR=1 FL=1